MIADTKTHYKNFFRSHSMVFLLLFIALIIRLLFLSEKSLWLDEVYSLTRAGTIVKNVSISQSIHDIATKDAHPPIYYLLLRFWSNIMPISPEIWLRLLSIFFDLATIFIFYRILLLFADKHSALLGTLILTTSSFLTFFAQEARHYALSNFLAILSCWFICKIILSQNPRYFIGYLLTIVIGFYTYYYLAFLFLTQGIFVFFYGGQQQNLTTHLREKQSLWASITQQMTFFYWLKTQVVAMILFFPWLYYVLPKKIALFSQFNVQQKGSISISNIYQMFHEHLLGLSTPKFMEYYFAAILLIFVAIFLWESNKKKFLICSIWWILPIVVLILFPYKGHQFQSKHLIYLLPIFIATLVIHISNRKLLQMVTFLICIGNIISLYHHYPQQKQPWQQAIQELYQNIKQGDVVCFNPYYLESPFIFYYKRQQTLANKLIMPGYANIADAENIPPQQRQFIYIVESDIKRARKKTFWTIEIENSDLAPPDPQIQVWCQKILKQQQQKIYPGVLGNIIITKYVPK